MSPDTSETTQKKFELLHENSKSLLDIQSSIFDQTRQNAATLLTLLAVFLPFFLNGLDDAPNWIKFTSLAPTILILIAMFLFLLIFRTQEFDRGFNVDKYQGLINGTYQDTIIYSLGANLSSYKDNKVVLSIMRRKYSMALTITYIAVLVSAATLLINKFVPSPDKITQVHLTNTSMANTPQPPIQIPQVPSRDRERTERGLPSGPVSPPRPINPPSTK